MSGETIRRSSLNVEEIFGILGIEGTRDEDEIRAAYRKLLLSANPEDDAEGFKRLRRAYEEAVGYARTPANEEIKLEEATPSLSQAQRLKKFSQDGKLDQNVITAIMTEEKKDVDKVTLQGTQIKKYFPKSYTPKQMEDTIIKLLEQWQRKRQREQER